MSHFKILLHPLTLVMPCYLIQCYVLTCKSHWHILISLCCTQQQAWLQYFHTVKG